MYKSKIFLVGGSKDSLIALEETGYMNENTLQELLADYPDLLPGDQIDPEAPRRWLFIAREVAVPGGLSEAGRWSLDHLFLDQDGIPTFVECKRSVDTRTRREVVAQMLEYAANGTEYWSIDRLRQAADETAKTRGKSLDAEIVRLIGEGQGDTEGYWRSVEENLREHRVRLVFITDSTPKELRRLVEFLNEEMVHVEVLVVEVKQFQGEGDKGQKALAPRVVGLTESARSLKESSRARISPTNREEFLKKCDPEVREFFQRVLDLAEERGYAIYWGTRAFSVRTYVPSGLSTFCFGVPPNEFQFYFGDFIRRSKEITSSLRSELLAFGVFREAGEWTMKATLTKENLPRMNEVYDFILRNIGELVRTQ